MRQIYWQLLQAGHPLETIDGMDIINYLDILAWYLNDREGIQEAYIDDVL